MHDISSPVAAQMMIGWVLIMHLVQARGRRGSILVNHLVQNFQCCLLYINLVLCLCCLYDPFTCCSERRKNSVLLCLVMLMLLAHQCLDIFLPGQESGINIMNHDSPPRFLA